MKSVTYILLITFCFSLFHHPVKAQDDKVKIGFILANLFMERWQRDKDFFEARVMEKGGEVIFKDCYDQPEIQISAARELIDEGVDIIVIIAVNAVAAAPVVYLANKAEIPVIAYDRLILNTTLDYYITFNSVTVGELMAETVINKLETGSILYIGGPSGDHNSVFLRQGVFNILNQERDRFTIHSTQANSWTELDAYLKIQDYLVNNEMPDAIICAADILTRGALTVLEENNMTGKVILTGQDAELDICRLILKDAVEMTIYKPGKLMAERAVEEVWNIITKSDYVPDQTTYNGDVHVPSVLLEPRLVNKETLESTVIKDGYYTKEQIYGE